MERARKRRNGSLKHTTDNHLNIMYSYRLNANENTTYIMFTNKFSSATDIGSLYQLSIHKAITIKRFLAIYDWKMDSMSHTGFSTVNVHIPMPVMCGWYHKTLPGWYVVKYKWIHGICLFITMLPTCYLTNGKTLPTTSKKFSYCSLSSDIAQLLMESARKIFLWFWQCL